VRWVDKPPTVDPTTVKGFGCQGCISARFTRKVNEVGNLLPLDRELNRDVKQKPFSEKRTSYADSAVQSVRGVAAKFEKWGVSEIDARTRDLVERLEEFLG
jgi:hypothetical protein